MKIKSMCLLMLVVWAVRCDDTSNYYVIEMPEENTLRIQQKPFKVYWNVPTMQCKSKKIPFENLYEKYGILQNKDDSFRGEKISILYDPGLFPALLKNDTSGKFKFRNGGVPQEGNLELHLDAFRNVLAQSIPEANFNGVGIIDFESWRPVFRQNFGVLIPYKDVSYEIEKKRHWWWPTSWVQAEAKKRFEESARNFMQATLALAKEMRPNAIWGYYGFPYCFNMQNNNWMENCASKVPEENDATYWLWSESTALYPSIYSSRDLTTPQLAGLVRGRVKEAERIRSSGTPILPYFWFRYREGGFLTEVDLNTVLKILYKSYAEGLIIWGSSKDVNTVDKCNKLHDYIENVMGPTIAKYTKSIHKIVDESVNNSILDMNNKFIHKSNDTKIFDDKYNITNVTTHKPTNFTSNLSEVNENYTTTAQALTKKVEYDPEFIWNPPENYTQDIVQYVEEEFKKYNVSLPQSDNDTDFKLFRHSSLVDILLNTLIDDMLTNNSNVGEIGVTPTYNDQVAFTVNDAKAVTELSSYDDSSTYSSSTLEYDIDTEFGVEYEIQLGTSTDISDYTDIQSHSTSTTEGQTRTSYPDFNKNTYQSNLTTMKTDISTIISDITTIKSDINTVESDINIASTSEETAYFTEIANSNDSKYTTETISSKYEDKLNNAYDTIQNNIVQKTSIQNIPGFPDESNSNTKIVDIEFKINIPVPSKNTKKGLPKRKIQQMSGTNSTSLSFTSTSSTDDQVTSSATPGIGVKYFIYIILSVLYLF